MTRRRLLAGVTAAVLVGLAAPAYAAPTSPVPTPTAPRPTSTAASPEAPDPHPPAGGDGPDGVVPGGPRLAERGLVLPRGAAALPAARTAKAWVLVDLGRGTVLAAQDPHGRYQPASVLKTLTALVLLPQLTGREKVPITQQAADTEGSAVGLVPGGSYSADILLRAMLMVSGNDATEALVGAAGGDDAVVTAMNSTIRGLGGQDTEASTPTGLDDWDQLTSAYDLALVLRAAVADARLLTYDATRRALLPAQTVKKNGQPVGTIEMDNQSGDFLDTYPGALFAKTGFTDAARHTFLAAARRGDTTLGVVYLRAERTPVDQWQQASALLDWGFRRPHTADAAVGTLDDPAALAARAATAAVASAAASASAAADAAAEAAASPTPDEPANGRGLAAGVGHSGSPPVAPLVYAGVVLLFVLAFARLERRRRRRR